MSGAGAGPCITRNDRTILLECGHPGSEEARAVLSGFAELVKSPPAYHTYRITPLSLWNAAAGDRQRQRSLKDSAGCPGGVFLPKWRGRWSC